jgi:hypothetical protein
MHHIFRTMCENLNANFKQNEIHICFESIQRLSYDLGDQGVRVRLPAGARGFFLFRNVQTASEAHPFSYTMGTGRRSLEDKEVGA